MNMIEKVAKAIALYEDSMEDYWEHYTGSAKAAIEAMREPTLEMVDEGMNSQLCDGEVRVIWTWMIDAALKED